MKILMRPSKNEINLTGGIGQVVYHWTDTLTEMGVEFVPPGTSSYDLKVTHAGKDGADTDICACHGLWWTADMPDAAEQYFEQNIDIVEAIRHARAVTVPSVWVAEVFQRDMRFTPYIVPHGINWREWENEGDGNFILFNKNRAADVCYPEAVSVLANSAPARRFVSTFAARDAPPNVHITGRIAHEQMKRLVQQCSVYLATTKETFGIGVLEAMAAGKPVLGFAYGGILDLVEHGVNGYLAQPGNYDELIEGLSYCLAHAETLGANGREMAKVWTWEGACETLVRVFEQALIETPPTVGVVIPTYNYGTMVGRAVESAMMQTYPHLKSIVVVDDGTQDGGLTEKNVAALAEKDSRVRYIRQTNKGVAVARNVGIVNLNTKYVCCLDADDAIESEFLSTLIPCLEEDRSLGLVYSNLYVLEHGMAYKGRWPGECDFDNQLQGKNQVPTCCVFRREAWKRLGGYRQRFAPKGCGAEDAEFWTRMGAYGWGMKRATEERLFLYTLGGNTTGSKDYEEPNWTAWHPWTSDSQHPFASIATPKNHASHPARQYDEPVISVVIPVGPGHEKHVVDALDSLEAQTFRKWEVIVVWDTADREVLAVLQTAYPYVKWTVTDGGNGAGKARNIGAAKARAPFLLFLDADDWLLPAFMIAVLKKFDQMETDAGICTDHFGISTVDNPTTLTPELQRSIREWNGKEAIIEYHPLEYNWQKAVEQPKVSQNNTKIWLDDPYIWTTITTLVPTTWFFEVGGFDEEMESWEDWDFFLRLARKGKCFAKVAEPLMVYRLHAGFRREEAKSSDGKWLRLARHMHDKYVQLGEPEMCIKCGSKSRQRVPMMPVSYAQTASMPQARPVNRNAESDMILVRYIRARRGQHSVVGAATRTHYGYRDYGDVFEIHRADYDLAIHWFQPVSMTVQGQEPAPAVRAPQAPASELPPPPKSLRGINAGDAEEVATPPEPMQEEAKSLAQAVEAIMGTSRMSEIKPEEQNPPKEVQPEVEPEIEPEVEPEAEPQVQPQPEEKPQLGAAASMLDISVGALPGMTPSITEQLVALGVIKVRQLMEWDLDKLQEVKGVGLVKAQKIRDALDAMGRT